MNFNEALERLKEGKPARRTKWIHLLKYIILNVHGNNTFVAVYRTSSGDDPTEYRLSAADIFANDWEVVE